MGTVPISGATSPVARIRREPRCVSPGMRALFLSGALVFAGNILAADVTFTGYARSLESGALLYVESHAVSQYGSTDEARVVLYRCAPGSAPFARKELSYAADRIAPSFHFDDARSGFSESFARGSAGLTVSERAGLSAQRRSATLAATPSLVADAGFDEFVRTRWSQLERGESANVPFLVPSRLASVGFHVRKSADTVVDGEPASVIRLSLAGPLGWFVPDIDVTYRKQDRRLLRYRGITNLRDADGHMIEAQIDFPDAGRGDGPVDLAALKALPLAACR
jgi:hypothetical protein